MLINDHDQIFFIYLYFGLESIYRFSITTPSILIEPFLKKIMGIKKIDIGNKFVCNYYWFYNFTLKEIELVYIFHIVFNVLKKKI